MKYLLSIIFLVLLSAWAIAMEMPPVNGIAMDDLVYRDSVYRVPAHLDDFIAPRTFCQTNIVLTHLGWGPQCQFNEILQGTDLATNRIICSQIQVQCPVTNCPDKK